MFWLATKQVSALFNMWHAWMEISLAMFWTNWGPPICTLIEAQSYITRNWFVFSCTSSCTATFWIWIFSVKPTIHHIWDNLPLCLPSLPSEQSQIHYRIGDSCPYTTILGGRQQSQTLSQMWYMVAFSFPIQDVMWQVNYAYNFILLYFTLLSTGLVIKIPKNYKHKRISQCLVWMYKSEQFLKMDQNSEVSCKSASYILSFVCSENVYWFRGWQIGYRKQCLKLHRDFKQLKKYKATSESVNNSLILANPSKIHTNRKTLSILFPQIHNCTPIKYIGPIHQKYLFS